MFFQKNGVIMSMMDPVYESAALAINPSRNAQPTDMSSWTKYGTGPYLQSNMISTSAIKQIHI